LLTLCWLWLVVCFTALRQAWWNSLWVGMMLSALSVLTAFRNVTSVFGVLTLIPAVATFVLLAIMKFG
ncbi:MAG: hypothetical protein ACREIW_10415, partial [Chthoniobacterales bacterium]